MITFNVPGEPQGKGRPRVTKFGTYTPEKTMIYENWIKACYVEQVNQHLGEGQIIMAIEIYYSIPKSATKGKLLAMQHNIVRPTKKPDCDNVLKAVADSLNGIAYKDDSQIVRATVAKYYSDNPRLVVNLEAVKP